MERTKKMISAGIVILALFALLFCSDAALKSSAYGLSLCAGVIVPSLLPFFIVANLASGTGLTRELGRLLSPFMSRLFGVSGSGASAFILGITGGYPLGAAVVSDMVLRREISVSEGNKLLMFCNNSGPAFIVGAVGVGVFGSAPYGLLLYLCHVLAAMTVGLIFRGTLERGRTESSAPAVRTDGAVSLGEALPEAVKRSVAALLPICGFVVTFTVLAGILDALGVFSELTGRMAVLSGMGLRASRTLLTGLLELGGGIGAARGLPPSPISMALCSFILGWGGLSVYCQTISVCAGSGIKTARHCVGRLLCGVISAVYAYVLSGIMLPRI